MTLGATRGSLLVLAALASGCGGGSSAPTGPSGSQSFLAGTWQGTMTIQVAPGPNGQQPATVGATTWTFEVVPQTNLQTFKATIRSENSWLPVTTVSTTAIIPGNTPPAQISTQGGYNSPRGCSGTFGSFGTAEATRIDADFTGVDCDHVTFTGRVILTKQ
jgi:hypothetical protein